MRFIDESERRVEIEDSENSSQIAYLSEEDWNTLIRDIRYGEVIPVIGPELITVVCPETNAVIPLTEYFAPKLALELGVPCRSGDKIRDVVSLYLLRKRSGGGGRLRVYKALRTLFDNFTHPPSESLCRLARIWGFRFWIAGTFDHQLLKALEKERADFHPKEGHISFHPSELVDIKENVNSVMLLHLLGDFNKYPDFAVWEEDYMEYICAFIKAEAGDTLERLFQLLKRRTLLLLGSPSSDWIVRFLLRAARQERLSERRAETGEEYLADRIELLEPPMVFYFDKLNDSTHVIDGDPIGFVEELCSRWEIQVGTSESDEKFMERLPTAIPKDSIFISYASEDYESAMKIARALDAANIPIWLDKARLAAGENYEDELRAAVRVHCSFFISLISEATESDTERERFVHKERTWAAEMHNDGFVFYIPVSLRPAGSPAPMNEPPCFQKIHYHKFPDGNPTISFVRHVKELFDNFRTSGRPRG